MPLPVADTVGILADNLALRRSVLPIPRESAVRWTRGLDLPRGGETVLYTGQMYQMIPFIEALVQAEEHLGASPLGRLAGLGRRVNRVLNLSAVMARPAVAEQEAYDRIPRNVALLLRRAGVEFGSLYEDDLYSGALLYDLGVDEVFRAHARAVAEVFGRYGVRRAITVDPHTTHLLRSVYPQVLESFEVEVSSYLEVLAAAGMGTGPGTGPEPGAAPGAGAQAASDASVAEGPARAEASPPAPAQRLAGAVAIHDSCVFARYEETVDAPRALLRATGLQVVEPAHSGRQSWCCGGPAESLFPRKAAAQAERRVAELRAAGDGAPCAAAVTMCPICFVNLSKAAGDSLRITDISEYLRQAYGA